MEMNAGPKERMKGKPKVSVDGGTLEGSTDRERKVDYKDMSSLKVFNKFVTYSVDDQGRKVCEAKGILSKKSYEAWLQSRRCPPKKPMEAFRRALTAHCRGVDGRRPFSEEVEASLLKELRKKQRWECFVGADDSCGHIGVQGFPSLGYHEKKKLETQHQQQKRNIKANSRKRKQSSQSRSNSNSNSNSSSDSSSDYDSEEYSESDCSNTNDYDLYSQKQMLMPMFNPNIYYAPGAMAGAGGGFYPTTTTAFQFQQQPMNISYIQHFQQQQPMFFKNFHHDQDTASDDQKERRKKPKRIHQSQQDSSFPSTTSSSSSSNEYSTSTSG